MTNCPPNSMNCQENDPFYLDGTTFFACNAVTGKNIFLKAYVDRKKKTYNVVDVDQSKKTD